MEYNTMEIIEKIRYFRAKTKIPVCFTLDAGPNVHLLYPEKYRKDTLPFVQTELLPLCDNNRWIDDRMGEGPIKIL
jgi:diphosphomevalonate decarboxylase